MGWSTMRDGRSTMRDGRSADGTGEQVSWWATGDINAFFGLMLDNVSDMILMASLLVGVFGFPAEFVLTRMIPGTAVGVLVGDLIYTLMAVRLARREGRSDVTAMPLGLDTPSTFGSVFLVLGPSFRAELERQELAGIAADPVAAAEHAWYVGITMLVAAGLFKVACAPVSGWIRRRCPRAGLLGSLVAIALVIISFLPLLEVAATPVTGMVSLALVLATLTARWRLSGWLVGLLTGLGLGLMGVAASGGTEVGWLVGLGIAGLATLALARLEEIPGSLVAVCVGAGLTHLFTLVGSGAGLTPPPAGGLGFWLPLPLGPWWDWLNAHGLEAAGYLPVVLPLALATVIGGIDCTESAAAAGDRYATEPIVAAEGVATLAAAALGGVIQSTPYIGHPAYKAMGGRAGYTLATGVFVGALGVFGSFGWVFHVLPRAAVYPILVFVGVEIAQQSFRATPRRHYPALVLACVPALAYLAYLMVDRLAGEVDLRMGTLGPAFGTYGAEVQQWLQVLTTLAGGFLVTSLLWGSWLAWLIDGRWRVASLALVLGAMLAWVGVIHSPLRGSPILWPAQVEERLKAEGRLEVSRPLLPHQWALAYLGMSAVVLVVGRTGKGPTAAQGMEPDGDAGSETDEPKRSGPWIEKAESRR
jgi:AGZA family xanthine/uracil permease-like MFS transporter